MTDLVDATRALVEAMQPARTTTLYELSADWMELLDALEDPEADQDEIERLLAVKGGAIKQKAESIAGLIVQCEAMADMRKAEAKRMSDGAKHFDGKAKWLREYLLTHMKLMEIPRIETGRFTLAIRKNQPHVEVIDEQKVPQRFKRVAVSIDKQAIHAHVKETGEVVEGTEMVRDEKLDIR